MATLQAIAPVTQFRAGRRRPGSASLICPVVMQRPGACGALVLALCLAATRAAPAQPGISEVYVNPPDVYSHVTVLAGEIELVRREMGAPKESRPAVVVKGAQPRDNFFQGLNLCRKTQRLCFDLTGDEGTFPPPTPPLDQISPLDVFVVVDAALKNIRQVKAQFGIKEETPAPGRDDSKIPSDVFRVIVGANRQLSLMLDTRPTPTMVYEQLTEAAGTASRILGRFSGAAEPKTPEFERGKTPADVHARLLRCADQVREIMKPSGLSTLEIDWRLTPDQVTPSDVYDLATLLVAELRYLETSLPRASGASAVIDLPPGRKLPSHNFQRAGLVEAQIAEIRNQLAAKPELLKQK